MVQDTVSLLGPQVLILPLWRPGGATGSWRVSALGSREAKAPCHCRLFNGAVLTADLAQHYLRPIRSWQAATCCPDDLGNTTLHKIIFARPCGLTDRRPSSRCFSSRPCLCMRACRQHPIESVNTGQTLPHCHHRGSHQDRPAVRPIGPGGLLRITRRGCPVLRVFQVQSLGLFQVAV